MLEDNKKKKSKNELKTRTKSSFNINDYRETPFRLELPPSVIEKRNRFVKLGETIDYEGKILNESCLMDVEDMSLLLKKIPKYENKIIKNNIPSFPVNIRNAE